eukprot:CAMPEP_0173378756 /NCGR_PEP_ID=MMETSP1356-20130122/1884_1 /TAXON_ID=77927 ORGANISM="Hemiselmis virescens, Strain PCC157" /NCGR_SAMPLE_ID=MMETSP1356 /ASSEMBLY_ACC=CAM_ASM_000847 /LENGTH=205 /DNA_ID=CAMNT_0014331935 /DNA_START=51 /DNA_END=664 /DNA_ORIENTATION=+
MGCFPFVSAQRKHSDANDSTVIVPRGNVPTTQDWKALSPASIKEISEVMPGVWLGSLHAAADHAALKQRGITHILNLAGRDAYAPDIVLFNEAVRNTQDPSSFTYKNKEVKDVSSAKLSNLFTETTGFIRQGAKAGGVLVHCMMGVSRSSSCVIAYLIDTKGMTFDDAFALVKSRRVAAIPNAGFTKQLREHARLRAERMAKGGG